MNEAIAIGIILVLGGTLGVLGNRLIGGMGTALVGKKMAERSGVVRSRRTGRYYMPLVLSGLAIVIGLECIVYGAIFG